MLFAAGLALAPFGAAWLQRIQPRRRVYFARWGFTHLIAAALAGLVVHGLAGALLEPSGLGALVRGDGYLLGALAVAVVAARKTQPEGWRSVGLAAPDFGRSAVFAAVTYLFTAPVLWGVSLGWPALTAAESSVTAPATTFAGLEGLQVWIGALTLGLVAPILREALFRGFFQPLLIQNFSERGGLLLSALAFALLHPIDWFLPALVLGAAAAVAQLRTGSLVASAGVHVLHQVTVLVWIAIAGAEQTPLPLF